MEFGSLPQSETCEQAFYFVTLPLKINNKTDDKGTCAEYKINYLECRGCKNMQEKRKKKTKHGCPVDTILKTIYFNINFLCALFIKHDPGKLHFVSV